MPGLKRTLPQLFIFHRTVPLQDWLRRDSALKAHSTRSRDPSPTSSCLIPDSPTTEHPAPSSVRGPLALTQTQQEMSRRRSPGPNAVTHQPDGTNAAEASPPLPPTQTHTKFRRGGSGGRSPPSARVAAALAARRCRRERRGRYSHIQARAAARLGHQPAAGTPPAAAARRRAPAPATPGPPGGNEAAAAAVGAPRSVPPPAGQTHLAAAPRRGRSRGREKRGRGDRRAGPASAPRRGPAQRRLPGRRGSEG